MADFLPAVTKTIDEWEDPSGKGVITEDDGGRTRFGVAEKYNPDMPPGFYDGSMPCSEARKAAEARYEDRYWLPLFPEIESQAVANKVFDVMVNPGKMKLIQRAINNCGERVVEDGRFGPICLNALNRLDERDFLPEIRSVLAAYYRQKVAEAPHKKKWLNGWLRRARS